MSNLKSDDKEIEHRLYRERRVRSLKEIERARLEVGIHAMAWTLGLLVSISTCLVFPTYWWLPHTPRRKMTRARAAAIFLRENGCCYVCRRKLRIGVDKYQIEHPKALSLGGSDADADLRVICDDCHKPKTAQDAAEKARRDRFVTEAWVGADKPKMRGPKFRPAASAAQRDHASQAEI